MTRRRQSGCSQRYEDPGVLGPQPSPRAARGRAGQPTPSACRPHGTRRPVISKHPAGNTWRRLQTTKMAESPSFPAPPPKAALPHTAQPQPLPSQAPAHSGTQTSAPRPHRSLRAGAVDRSRAYRARTWLGRVLMDGFGIGGHHKGRGGRPRAESWGRKVPV